MAVLNLDDIPGYTEAVRWEAEVRGRAFLDVPYSLCGVEVLPLTLHRLAILEAARSPLVCGGSVLPEDLASFLWVVSPEFRPGSADIRTTFIARLRAGGELIDLEGCVRQAGEFLDEMFLDSPHGGGEGKSSASITSTEAVYVEIFAESCGWSAEQTLHTPLPRLYQVLRRITLRKDPDARFINRRSDKVRGDWQRSLQAA